MSEVPPPVVESTPAAPRPGIELRQKRGISDGMGLRPAGLDRAADADGRSRSSSASTTSSSSRSWPASCRAEQQAEARTVGLGAGDGHAHPAAALDRLDHPADASRSSPSSAQEISGRDLILLVGGLFLIGKATHEIHDKLEGEEGHAQRRACAASFAAVIVQILLLDIVFSLDSVITAVGMVERASA